MPATLCQETISRGHYLPQRVFEKLVKQTATGLKNVLTMVFFSFPPHAEIAKANNNLVSFAHCISLG